MKIENIKNLKLETEEKINEINCYYSKFIECNRNIDKLNEIKKEFLQIIIDIICETDFNDKIKKIEGIKSFEWDILMNEEGTYPLKIELLIDTKKRRNDFKQSVKWFDYISDIENNIQNLLNGYYRFNKIIELQIKTI